MPAPGDEGYEKLLRCPYDQAHEIRKGRMQFHIEKCRRNFPDTPLKACPFNKMHLIKEQEMKYHLEEDCVSKTQWERYSHANESQVCPVRDLVPVNDATVPDGGENWDDCEAPSVLAHIQKTLNEKPVVRHFQVHSKAKKKAFRKSERDRHRALNNNMPWGSQSVAESVADESEKSEDSSESEHPQEPLPKPKWAASMKMDKNEAIAIINKNMKKLAVEAKPPVGDVSPLEGKAFDSLESASTSQRSQPAAHQKENLPAPSSSSQQGALSYATASRAGGKARGIVATPDVSRPGSAQSHSSFATASRPSSAMSSNASALGPPPGFTSRPATGMSTASFRTANQSGMSNSSLASYPQANDGFCALPIPGHARARAIPFARGRKPVA